MKQISAELKAHLAQEVTTLANCWKVTRRDGVVQGFTEHDADIAYEGVVYSAATGFTPTAVQATSSLSVDNLDIEGMLHADAISEADIMAGLYDFAEIEVFMVNYADVTQGKMVVRTGWLGEVTLRDGAFVGEVRGLTQKLSQQIGVLYAPGCRAQLGDSKCGVSLASHTVTGVVSEVGSAAMFADNSRSEGAGYFSHGAITFTGGANSGLSMEIKEFSSGQFTLVMPMPYEVAIGDSYSVVAGCDKRFATCVERFGNAVNFRGEPHVPGMDRMLETASTRSEWE